MALAKIMPARGMIYLGSYHESSVSTPNTTIVNVKILPINIEINA
jgi:hypothetical protein